MRVSHATLCLALGATLVGCAPCEPLNGTYVLTAMLRAGGSECNAFDGTGILVFRDGVSTSPSSTVCTGYREWSTDRCDVTFDEDCMGVDMFGPYTFGRVGTISAVGGGRHEGVLQLEFLSYYPDPFNCVFDLTYVRQ